MKYLDYPLTKRFFIIIFSYIYGKYSNSKQSSMLLTLSFIQARLSTEKLCRFCGIDDESAEHLLCYCNRFEYVRSSIFGNSTMTLNDFQISKLILFLRNTNLILKFIEFDMNKK